MQLEKIYTILTVKIAFFCVIEDDRETDEM